MIDAGSCHPYAINLESLDWFDDVEKKFLDLSISEFRSVFTFLCIANNFQKFYLWKKLQNNIISNLFIHTL